MGVGISVSVSVSVRLSIGVIDSLCLSARGARDAYAGGQEKQKLPFILSSFHLSCLVKGHFPAL